MPTNHKHQTPQLSGLRPPAFALIAVFCAFLCSIAPAIAPAYGQSGPRSTVPRLRAADNTIYAFPGRPLVFQVKPAAGDAPAFLPAGSHTVRTDANEQLPATLHFITALYPFPEPGDWLNPPGQWTAITLDQAAARFDADTRDTAWLARGFWVVRVELPETIAGRQLLLDGQRLPIRWLNPPPPRTDASRAPSPAVPAEVRRALGERLRPLTLDPALRWRVRLLADRIRPAALWGNRLPQSRIEPDVLEDFASRIEDRWRAAIAAVERGDPDAASALASRLTTVARMPDGSLLPAWSTDTSGEAQLLTTLLDETLPVDTHVASAESFVAAQPPAVAWVIDESAPAANRPYATVCITNLTDARARGNATSASAPTNRSLPVEPHATETFIAVADTTKPASLFEITAQLDSFTARPAALPSGLPATPPGLRMGPLVAPWSLNTWLAQTPTPMPPDRATGAMLFPEPDLQAWRLYIECNAPPAPATPPTPQDTSAAETLGTRPLVRLWFGQRHDPRAIITIQPDGRAFDETLGSPIPLQLVSHGLLDAKSDGQAARNPSVAGAVDPTKGNEGLGWSGGGWWAMLRLPISAYEPDGSLVMAIERIDASGYRSTWPRPVLPKQDEPGRVRIDLTQW